MLRKYLAILVAIVPSIVTQLSAQAKSDVNLSSGCFDSLPYGTAHACTAFIGWKSKASLGALFTTVSTLVAMDSLTPTTRDSSDTGVAVIVDSQIPRGKCARPATGPDWISPSIAIHFDATRLSKEESRYVILVRGSAISVQGNAGGSMVLALCYLGSYGFPLDTLGSPASRH